MLRYFQYILIALLITGCEETTELDLRQTPSLVVIEGLVTNQSGYQSVKVSRSTNFYANGPAPRITDATVTVTDEEGLVVNFVHNPRGKQDSVGIYVPETTAFTGQIGRAYTLRVNVDGESFEATDRLLSVTPIDSLRFRISEDQQDDPEESGKIYEMLLFAREPQDESNYYLFKYYRNDTLIVFNPTDIYYSDDQLFGENINGIPSPVYYGANDKARLEAYSLSRAGYVYYSDLSTILNNDGGGMFGPIPAPPRTNISNNALGFFQVSAIHGKESYIE